VKQNASAAVSKTVIDSSAVLAYLLNEPGGHLVEQEFGDALISTVNLAEVVTKLLSRGKRLGEVRKDLGELGMAVVDFTRDLAEDTGALIVETAAHGLSLGDRACLALARREKLPVLTADRIWEEINAGVQVELIR
jgi:PIN domain nuclease of toxin-antitoxin system